MKLSPLKVEVERVIHIYIGWRVRRLNAKRVLSDKDDFEDLAGLPAFGRRGGCRHLPLSPSVESCRSGSPAPPPALPKVEQLVKGR